MNQSFQVILMPVSIWEPLIENSFSSLGQRVKAVAHGILTTLHNRHIGITPLLAAQLARLVMEPHSLNQDQGKWAPVLKRLLEESSKGLRSAGVLLSAIPLYSIIRLAAPIIEEACTRTGLCFLFCRDEVKSDAGSGDYQIYENHLEDEIRKMAANHDDFFNTFWKDRALTLASYSRHVPEWGSTEARLAEIEPASLGLLLRLSPRISQPKALAIHPRTAVNPMRHRQLRRLREGGFSGIHITHRVEDMGDILMSEFINPPAVLADRLINNGYLALRHQTKREQLRDVLVVGMMPHQVKPRASTDFIKACWFDFIARFGFILYRSRLMRSEFRWLEGDAFNRVRECNFLLKELPGQDIPVEGDLTPQFRREFLMSLGWLPQYLDNRGKFRNVPIFNAAPQQLDVSGERGTHSERQWAYSSWRSQKENLAWAFHEAELNEPGTPGSSSTRTQNLDVGGYAFVHIMLFLPGDKRTEQEASSAARLGPLFSGLGISGGSGGTHNSASITWVPQKLTDYAQWAFDGRGNRFSNLFHQHQTKGDLRQIAGRLEEAWRKQLLKELQDG